MILNEFTLKFFTILLINQSNISSAFYLFLRDILAKARINRGHIRQVYTVCEGDKLELPCPASGLPKPEVSFTKQSRSLDELVGKNRTLVSQERQMLTIFSVVESDAGAYKCKAKNDIGWDVFEYLVLVDCTCTKLFFCKMKNEALLLL